MVQFEHRGQAGADGGAGLQHVEVLRHADSRNRLRRKHRQARSSHGGVGGGARAPGQAALQRALGFDVDTKGLPGQPDRLQEQAVPVLPYPQERHMSPRAARRAHSRRAARAWQSRRSQRSASLPVGLSASLSARGRNLPMAASNAVVLRQRGQQTRPPPPPSRATRTGPGTARRPLAQCGRDRPAGGPRRRRRRPWMRAGARRRGRASWWQSLRAAYPRPCPAATASGPCRASSTCSAQSDTARLGFASRAASTPAGRSGTYTYSGLLASGALRARAARAPRARAWSCCGTRSGPRQSRDTRAAAAPGEGRPVAPR